MLLFLTSPVTGGQLLAATVILVLAAFIFIMIAPWRKSVADDDPSAVVSGYRWVRKSALPILAVVALFLYPFYQPVVQGITNLIYGVPDVAHAGNATGAEIAAGQLAGGGVQLGTLFTKFWIAMLFYLLFCWLPWQVQKLTHPAPTAWAKSNYKTDFDRLSPEEKFVAYGRLQYVNTAKIIGAALAAALLV